MTRMQRIGADLFIKSVLFVCYVIALVYCSQTYPVLVRAFSGSSVCVLFLHLKIENNRMKRKAGLVVLLFIMLAGAGCRKCYYCQNSCSICQDAHFRILVQSDIYGTAYYNMYLDSLASLGWTCHDTTYNKDMQVCAESSHTLNGDVNLAQQQGYTCTAVPQ